MAVIEVEEGGEDRLPNQQNEGPEGDVGLPDVAGQQQEDTTGKLPLCDGQLEELLLDRQPK